MRVPAPISQTLMKEPVRHLTSINDLTTAEIEEVFNLAGHYLHDLSDSSRPNRIARSTDVATGRVLAALFYEPSTRTRLSFESAMLRLGGKNISSADPATSSAAKGESLADTVRIVENYADIVVIRHPRDGAAKLAAEYASVPIINGGDGAHEHPTQTLCDLFTLKREYKQLAGLNVAVQGDLKGSRTIHSFVYALARLGANIILMPAKGMSLPAHVDSRLREEFRCAPLEKAQYDNDGGRIETVYSADTAKSIRGEIDVLYVTRFQKERWTNKKQQYPRIDAKFLQGVRYAHTRVMHALPRVNELDSALDNDPRAIYFRQASYGVPIRMVLISQLLELSDAPLARFDGGFRRAAHPIEQLDEADIRCANANCIVHDPHERPYARNKFYLLQSPEQKFRCFYCETDIPKASGRAKPSQARKRK
jgi:aspartate carbamoyltransferase catalytic subunit